MKAVSLMLLRISIGLLVFIWGIDKVVNVDHGLAISERFYAGAFSNETVMAGWGIVQSAIGILVVVGLLRKYVYPATIVINVATLLVVWRSIIDPWGWFLEGTNALFFPSLTIAAGSFLLWAFMDEDSRSLDARWQHSSDEAEAASEPRQPANY